ncbi:MAG TPA: HAMP domain-containing sensor histidine kinase [Alphaproteobacteria bacterium]|nr:HAMP domain-containing sensor histidine kinase [Alphaproteobacteria bacterium]
MGPAQAYQAPVNAPAAQRKTTPQNAEEDRCAAFEQSRLQLIQRSLLLARFVVPVTALVAGALFTIWDNPWVVAAWSIAYSITTIAAVTIILRMRGDSRNMRVACRSVVMAGVLLSVSNAVWALLAVLFWRPSEPTNQFFIILVLASGVPYTMAMTAVSFRAFLISVAPIVLALVLRPLFAQGLLFHGIAALSVLYCAMMFSVATQLHRTTTSMLRIKENNSDLLVQLARAKAESDAARYRAERLNQAKSTFLANMSHELRTPLNAILGFSEVIHNEMLGPIGLKTYKEYAGDIHASGKHLLGLINDILDLSRIEAGRVDLAPVVLSVAEVAGDIMRLAEVGARKNNVTLLIDIPSGVPHIRVDERALRQVLINLVTNAIKFTPGGKVTISARAGSSVYGPKGLTITVEDTGVGIKKEDLAMVLEAFGQVRVEDLAMTAPREQGTGLGLPIVRGLVEAHGGKFVLESEFGKGTRAIVHLPLRCVLDPAQIEEPPTTQRA